MKPVTLRELAEGFDVLFIDQFGVLIDAHGTLPKAIEAVTWLVEAGKKVTILTNSGKRSKHTEKRLERLGFPVSEVSVLSSGEVARARLCTRFKDNTSLTVWYEADTTADSPLGDLGVRFVDQPQEADLMVIAGVRSETVGLEHYTRGFTEARARDIPCICTNPDQERLTLAGKRFAAGRLAAIYQEMGGQVEWIGKPHRAIYDHALLGIPSHKRVVCLGDSVAHDIVGATHAGLSSALVRTGLASGLSVDGLDSLCVQNQTRLDYILDNLDVT